MRTPIKISLVVAAALGAALLAGCSGSNNASSTPTVTDTVTTAPQPSSTESSQPSDGSSAAPTTGTGTGAPAACQSTNLTAAITPNAGGGAAGSTYVSLVLTNKGAATCTLQGWPGVSFVGSGNGTQIGQAAAFDRTTSHATVTLAAGGGTATSTLRIVHAENYSDADCSPRTADGFRVYPPGQKASIFAKDAGVAACADKNVSLLTVSGLK